MRCDVVRSGVAFLISVTALGAASTSAVAQERSINFALRGGVAVAPSYPGANSSEVRPDIGVSFGALNFGGFNIGTGVDGVARNGVSLGGAFRVIGDREVADNPELAGLEDVDTAVELGLRLRYQQTNWRAFGEVRKGVTGHSGVTGTLGADAIFRPNDRLYITMGPRVAFGDDSFANTYFGVANGTANFATFDADGGALGAGFEIKAVYDLNEKWAIDGAVSYEKLLGDAADSPITAVGSEDQWSLRIGLRREFTFRF